MIHTKFISIVRYYWKCLVFRVLMRLIIWAHRFEDYADEKILNPYFKDPEFNEFINWWESK